MNKFIIKLVIICLFSTFLYADLKVSNEVVPSANIAKVKKTLLLDIKDITVDNHVIYAVVYSKKEDFLDARKAVYTFSFLASEERLRIPLEGLEYGVYAITLFHDINANKKMDTGLFGIPSEPVAISTEYRPLFGPPNFENAKFEYSETNTRVHFKF